MNRPSRLLVNGIAAGLTACVVLSFGCDQGDRQTLQGYVEGEFVYMASPLAGSLERLHVKRGTQVKAGAPLFELDDRPEQAARDEAERKLAQARATLEDVKKGKRPSEIEALEAQLKQARAAVILADKEFLQQERLMRTPGATAELEFLRARALRDQNRQRLAQIEADLRTARLGSRADQITAAESNVRALEAALSRAEWDLSQKRQTAPQDALIFDTLYREGEWVPAGRPVVVLLPPGNVKVRAFVPETQIADVQPGDTVRVGMDGRTQPVTGTVSFVSPRAEYTPPVIYSQDTRSKLVFMIEAVFDRDTSMSLNPGQPVDVELGKNHAP
ncbi:MAG TPA: HlyD family efflux transporter periplasmic adaptor subunit [Nitrospiraceae bacterium]|nr:HlyD family efflux transporter periplasmic adaptor subunit [Nitrospiraceae bacterium]